MDKKRWSCSRLRLELLLRIFRALQTFRVHPKLDIRTLNMNKFWTLKSGTQGSRASSLYEFRRTKRKRPLFHTTSFVIILKMQQEFSVTLGYKAFLQFSRTLYFMYAYIAVFIDGRVFRPQKNRRGKLKIKIGTLPMTNAAFFSALQLFLKVSIILNLDTFFAPDKKSSLSSALIIVRFTKTPLQKRLLKLSERRLVFFGGGKPFPVKSNFPGVMRRYIHHNLFLRVRQKDLQIAAHYQSMSKNQRWFWRPDFAMVRFHITR